MAVALTPALSQREREITERAARDFHGNLSAPRHSLVGWSEAPAAGPAYYGMVIRIFRMFRLCLPLLSALRPLRAASPACRSDATASRSRP